MVVSQTKTMYSRETGKYLFTRSIQITTKETQLAAYGIRTRIWSARTILLLRYFLFIQCVYSLYITLR